MRTFLLKCLEAGIHAPADALLHGLEQKFGWKARHEFEGVILNLRNDRSLPSEMQNYLVNVLTDEAIRSALIGGATNRQMVQSTFADLVRISKAYRNSEAFRDAVEFSARFRDYAPFNNMLVKVQNPHCGFYATARDWRDRFQRTMKEDARPMLILAPMHPVMLVYDLDSTEGPPLPDKYANFATADGSWCTSYLESLLSNAERHGIQIQFHPLSSVSAGFATTRVQLATYWMRVVVNSDLDEPARFLVLCHELAHIHLGHLGTEKGAPWPCRLDLSHETVEIEAEAVAYILATRCGLESSSARYLSTYISGDTVPEAVSLEHIGKVAGRLLEMCIRTLPERRPTPDVGASI
jgi:hypothetical protein